MASITAAMNRMTLTQRATPAQSSTQAPRRIATFQGFKQAGQQTASLAVRANRNVRLAATARPVIKAATVAEPEQVDLLSFDGSKSGSETLALKTAPNNSAKGLVHRYLVLVRQNARQGNASTKTRSEIRGGGKKPYAQKGTGNARRGSSRSPLFPGGGVSFGPKPRDWTIKMNKKERRLAMSTALQSASASMVVVEDLSGKFSDKKTKVMSGALKAWGVDESEHALLITKEQDADMTLSGRNIEKLKMMTLSHLNVYDVLRADKIIVEKSALEGLHEMFA